MRPDQQTWEQKVGVLWLWQGKLVTESILDESTVIRFEAKPAAELAGKTPGAPKGNRGDCQHHPGQFPISDFFDHPHHGPAPLLQFLSVTSVPSKADAITIMPNF